MKLRLLPVFPFAVSAMLLSVSVSHSAFADSIIPVSADNNNYRPMGAGFDSRKSEFRGDCVEVSNITTPDRQISSGSMSLKLEASQSALADKLGLSLGGKYRSGVTTTSASAEFLNESKANAYSISYNYVSEDGFQEYAENSKAHPIVARPGIEDYLKDQRPFFQYCGDEYVYARKLAARLLINLKVTFVSKYEKQKFAAAFGVESAVYNVEGKFEKSSSSFSSSNTLSVRVEQQGGDPSKKGRILCPTLEDGKADPECARSALSVVNCSFGDLAPCMKVLANAIAYANAQDGENFPSQIANGKNYAVTQVVTRPFRYIGAQFPAAPDKTTEDTFQAELSQLNSIFEEEYEKWSYSHQLAFGKIPRLSDRQREEMNGLEALFLRNMSRVSTAIENCYAYGYSKCRGELEATRNDIDFTNKNRPGLASIEKLTLPEVFIQWCDLANAEHPSLQSTIQSLKTYLLQTKILDVSELSKGDLCTKLDDRLQSLRELDLSDPTLAVDDLRPIGALSNLETLKIPRKNLTSIGALKSLTKLKTLDVSNNALTSLDSLRTLTSLQNLDGRGNSASLTCPLANPAGCKLLDFSQSVTVALRETQCSIRVGASAIDIGGGRVLVSGGFASNGSSLYLASMEIQTRDKCVPLSTNMSRGRALHTSSVLPDGRILIAGGFSDAREIFDPATNSVETLAAKFHSRRSGQTATGLADGRIVFVGGHTGAIELALPGANSIAEVEVFDPKTKSLESWGSLSVPRQDHTATLLSDQRILIVGGYQEGRMTNAVEIVDPRLKTIESLDLPLTQGRAGHSAVRLENGQVVIAGGYSRSVDGDLKPLRSIELFDPQTETFKTIQDTLEVARGKMAATLLLDGRVLFAGGDTSNAAFDTKEISLASAQKAIEIYDPATEGVYSAGLLSYPRHQFAFASIGKRGYLMVGGTGAPEALKTSDLLVYR